MVCVARAHADVPDVARLHHVVQRVHGLLDRRRIVEPMAFSRPSIPLPTTWSGGRRTLQEVDVVHLEALETGLNRVEDVLHDRHMVLVYTQLADHAGRTLRLRPFWLMMP